MRRADLNRRETADQKDEDIHGDCEVRDEAHDSSPTSDGACALSHITTSELSDMLKLDLDFEQIRQE